MHGYLVGGGVGNQGGGCKELLKGKEGDDKGGREQEIAKGYGQKRMLMGLDVRRGHG